MPQNKIKIKLQTYAHKKIKISFCPLLRTWTKKLDSHCGALCQKWTLVEDLAWGGGQPKRCQCPTQALQYGVE